jgi:dihydrolipoamide dehydrogenase
MQACHEAVALIERQLDALAAPASRRGTIARIHGRARFIDAHTVAIGDTTISADRFLIAVGSKPRVPPGITVDGERVVTSDQIEHVAELPRRLAIVGAGVVGCEYATMFAQLGHTAVELFDRQDRILPFEDADVSAVVASRFAEIGVTVHRKARIDRITRDGDSVEIAWRDADERACSARYDRVLVATGRAPALAGLDVERAGLAIAPDGGLATTSTRTAVPHIWAAGDVTPELMLANLAELEARHAVEAMRGLQPPPIVYQAQSAIYFLSPEVGAVGLDEQGCRKSGIAYRAAVVSNRLNRRNLAMRSTAGFVKLLAGPDNQLLGLRVVGPQAGTCIQGVALLIGERGTLEDIDRCVHPHPAVTEGVLEAARLLLDRSIYKPDAMGELCAVTEWSP